MNYLDANDPLSNREHVEPDDSNAYATNLTGIDMIAAGPVKP